ncbi:MAG: hypothetical protein AAFR33_12275 [Pseudomonadota bacterium]
MNLVICKRGKYCFRIIPAQEAALVIEEARRGIFAVNVAQAASERFLGGLCGFSVVLAGEGLAFDADSGRFQGALALGFSVLGEDRPFGAGVDALELNAIIFIKSSPISVASVSVSGIGATIEDFCFI